MKNIILFAVSTISVLFLIVPIATLVMQAIESQAYLTTDLTPVISALRLSAMTTGVTVILTVLCATPVAYVLARRRFIGRRLIIVLTQLPIVLPPAVAGLALLLTFGRRGLLGPTLNEYGITIPFTAAAVIIAQVFVAAPFYIRAAQVGFQNIPREIEDAARVDGAGSTMVFLLITVPLARRTLGAGLSITWARALGEFGATILFAGSLEGRTRTMPLLIYNIFERDIEAAIYTGVVLMALALVALLIAQILSTDEQQFT